MIKILLDPGHIGGYNGGVSKGYYEGTRMFEYSHYLKEFINEYNGMHCDCTRNNVNENPSLEHRGKMAVNGGYDVFISNHSNAVGNGGAHSACGVVTFRSIHANQKAIDFAKLMTDVVVNCMNAGTGCTYSRGVQTRLYPNSNTLDYYGVVRAACGGRVVYNMLIEHGFHTNVKECAWLNNSDNLKNMARTVAKSMAQFFGCEQGGGGTVTLQKTSVCGHSEVSAEQMYNYLKALNADAPNYAQIFLDEGAKEGIRGDIAFAQSCHETGNFKFTGDVVPEQNNFAGIGTTGGGVKGAYFETPTIGVRAQIQHLKAYANKDALVSECVDPRFALVTRGVAPNVEDLGGRWAVPGYDKKKYSSIEDALVAKDTYGDKIVFILNKIKKADGDKPVVPDVPKPTTGLYRVRKTWADANSQIGAYSILDNAKLEADKHNGYFVFDDKGNVVYPTTGNSFNVGDTVYFAGGKHYVSSEANNGSAVSAGNAKITNVANSAKHPYHIVHADNKSAVYGWVDANTISKNGTTPPTSAKKVVTVGGKVKVAKAVQYDSGKSFKLYYDVYDVISMSGNRVVIGIGKNVTAAVHKDNLIAL